MKTAKKHHGHKKYLFYGLVSVLFIWITLSNLDQLSSGLGAAKNAELRWVVTAALSLVLTYFFTALGYMILSPARLQLPQTAGVQVASSFANRLLPGGVGGLGLNIHYLIKNGNKVPQAGSVATVNTISAVISHWLLLILALLLSRQAVNPFAKIGSLPGWAGYVLLVGFGIVLVALLYERKLYGKARSFFRSLWKELRLYRRKKQKIALAIAIAAIVTGGYVFALFSSVLAVGLDTSFMQIFTVYSVGVLVGAAVFTPGGLGGVEAGLIAGLTGMGADPALAVSAVIVYRLVTFWLPIFPGYLMFIGLRHYKVI